jgi:hypothetical protein
MSYYTNRIDEKMVGKRKTSKLKKQLAATQKELADTKVYHSAAQDQIKKLNRREHRDATSPVPKERAFHHYLSKDREDFGGKARKLKSGEVPPVSPGKRGENQSQVRKVDATVRGSNTQQATGKGSKAMRRMANKVSPREIFMKTIKNKLPQDTWGFTEAVYNSYVDLASIICEMQTRQGKGRLLRPGEKPSRGKVFRSKEGERTTVTEKPTHLTGAYGDSDKDPGRVRARIKKNIAMQNPQEPRKGTVASKKAKRYKRLHQRANAGDKKAMELLRRAEMSGND